MFSTHKTGQHLILEWTQATGQRKRLSVDLASESFSNHLAGSLMAIARQIDPAAYATWIRLAASEVAREESPLWQVTPKPDGSCDVKPAPAPTPSKAQWVGQIVQTRVAQGATNLRREVEQAQTAYDAIYGGGK